MGEGWDRWPVVHKLDADRLFRLPLEDGTAGSAYHAVAEEGIPFREIAKAIGERLKMPVVSKIPDETSKQLSFLSPFIAVDKLAPSTLTHKRLGWRPTQPAC